MISQKKVLCIIPARGGSKGIPRKNLVDLGGKPLIAHSIECALESAYIDRVIISTEDEEIAEVSKAFGGEVPFLRLPELASDEAKTIDALMYTVERLKEIGELYDLLVLLQPTQPFRAVKQVDEAIALCIKEGKSVVSISPVLESPILMRLKDGEGRLSNLLDRSSTIRRQDMPSYYLVNGSIYVNIMKDLSLDTSLNDNPLGYVMEGDSFVDIDTPRDLEWARFLWDKKDKS